MGELYCGPAPVPETLLLSWNLDPVAILVTICLGVWVLARRAGNAATVTLTTLLILLFVSPLCALSVALFSARVLHHIVLVAVIAPLIARSLPRSSTGLNLSALVIVHAAVFWAWHYPPFYDSAMRSPLLYWLMQASLLGTAVALWRGVFRSAHFTGPILALFATATQMGMLGALLTFAANPLYLLHVPNTGAFGFSPIEDQQLAGLIMWVPGALPYLAMAALLVWRRLDDSRALERA